MAFSLRIRTIISTFQRIVRYGVPDYVVCFGDSLGDNLMLTSLYESLAQRGKNIWVKCDHAFLFSGNPDVKLVLPFQTLLSSAVLRLFNVKTIYPSYTSYDAGTDRDEIPEKHILLKMADALHIRGAVRNKPALYLTAEELQGGCMGKRHIVIATSTSGASVPMRNKEWLHGRYQELVDALSDTYPFIQLGSASDAPLRGVTDLRGRTSVRESAAILHHALLVVTHIGLLMHLARAVDCRAVVLFGGRERPEQSGYHCFENIYTDIACSPCWLHNKCDFDRKCMQLITTDQVHAAISKQLGLGDEPLIAETLING